jgi:hypothetical protein
LNAVFETNIASIDIRASSSELANTSMLIINRLNIMLNVPIGIEYLRDRIRDNTSVPPRDAPRLTTGAPVTPSMAAPARPDIIGFSTLREKPEVSANAPEKTAVANMLNMINFPFMNFQPTAMTGIFNRRINIQPGSPVV